MSHTVVAKLSSRATTCYPPLFELFASLSIRAEPIDENEAKIKQAAMLFFRPNLVKKDT